MPHHRQASKLCALALLAVLAAGLTVAAGRGTPSPAASQRGGLSFNGLASVLGSETSMGVTPRTPAAGIRSGVRPQAGSCGPDYGYLTTNGHWIVSASNPSCKVRLAGVTWYGFQSTNFVLAGLDFKPIDVILKTIANLGFNSVRIPLSDQLVKYNSKIVINPKWMKAEPPAFRRHLHPLTLLDRVVAQAKADHLMIILDNHFSKARNASDVANHSNARPRASRRTARRASSSYACRATTACPLWYGAGYTQRQWIADWVSLTKRYLNNPTVIGYDLRNEPHTNWQGHNWNLHDYLNGGATWGPCPKRLCGSMAGQYKPSSNWIAGAEAGGNAILKINPHLLMFVEGTQLYPKPSAKRKVEPYWWGSILKGVALHPVRFDVPNQLVYSPHEWGPWKCCGDESQREFGSKTTYKSVVKIFTENWAYILNDKTVEAPIWLGEFNTCNSAQFKTRAGRIRTANDCVYGTKPGSEGQWFQILIRFLQNNPEIGWSYYPLNGTNVLNEPSNNSVLGCPQRAPRKCNKWGQVRVPLLMTYLKTIETQPGR